jgi:hypothetical protein
MPEMLLVPVLEEVAGAAPAPSGSLALFPVPLFRTMQPAVDAHPVVMEPVTPLNTTEVAPEAKLIIVGGVLPPPVS